MGIHTQDPEMISGSLNIHVLGEESSTLLGVVPDKVLGEEGDLLREQLAGSELCEALIGEPFDTPIHILSLRAHASDTWEERVETCFRYKPPERKAEAHPRSSSSSFPGKASGIGATGDGDEEGVDELAVVVPALRRAVPRLAVAPAKKRAAVVRKPKTVAIGKGQLNLFGEKLDPKKD